MYIEYDTDDDTLFLAADGGEMFITRSELEELYANLTAFLGRGEYRCPKCGAQADERFDCCEVHQI